MGVFGRLYHPDTTFSIHTCLSGLGWDEIFSVFGAPYDLGQVRMRCCLVVPVPPNHAESIVHKQKLQKGPKSYRKDLKQKLKKQSGPKNSQSWTSPARCWSPAAGLVSAAAVGGGGGLPVRQPRGGGGELSLCSAAARLVSAGGGREEATMVQGKSRAAARRRWWCRRPSHLPCSTGRAGRPHVNSVFVVFLRGGGVARGIAVQQCFAGTSPAWTS